MIPDDTLDCRSRRWWASIVGVAVAIWIAVIGLVARACA